MNLSGILSVHKPPGLTSHDVVARLRRLGGTRRVGHAGTLDPMAEGVLVCALGRATRALTFLVGLPKEYTGELRLGAESDTYDAEGRIREVADPSGITDEDIREALRRQTGLIEQVAPPYSAVKVNGQKLYEYARRGEEVPVKRRAVWVEHLSVLRRVGDRVTFLARVGSGTYIRSIAHDTGRMLGCGAHLTALCRNSVGAFHIDGAADLEALEAEPEQLPGHLLGIAEGLAHLPKLILTPAAAEALRHGRGFELADILEAPEEPPAGRPLLALAPEGATLAVVQRESGDTRFRPRCVWN